MPTTLEGRTSADVDTPLLEPPRWPVQLGPPRWPVQLGPPHWPVQLEPPRWPVQLELVGVGLGQAVSARVVALKIHANYK